MKVLLSLIQQWDPFWKGKAVWSQRNCTSTHWYQKAILSNLAIPQGSGSGTMKLETHVRLISSLCTLFTPHKAFPYFTMVVMTRPMKQMMGSVHCSSHRIMKQLVSVLLWYTSFFENWLGLPFSPRPDRWMEMIKEWSRWHNCVENYERMAHPPGTLFIDTVHNVPITYSPLDSITPPQADRGDARTDWTFTTKMEKSENVSNL